MTSRNKSIVTVTIFTLLSAGFVVGALFLSNKYLGRKDKPEATCGTVQTDSHMVTIKDDKADPENTNAKLCDTLTILNADNKIRLMAFGVHENHITYDGVEEKVLRQGDSLTVTLVKAGTFTFHDHVKDEAQGSFTVEAP